jgi:choline-sulfatase
MKTKGIVPGVLAAIMVMTACRGAGGREGDLPSSPPSSILLVTLDTTRADSIGPEATGIDTPAFNALAARGLRFRQAYATVPETLPSHTSMMTGLYPAGHGVHENGRTLPANHAVLAEQLQNAGYRTTAFVSSFILSRRFGLARGFELYDDGSAPGQSERSAPDTTAAALAELQRPATGPRFMWVHYFDPHAPYTPPAEFLSRYPKAPYVAEIAAVDRELGRLVAAFDTQVKRERGTAAVIVVADHGEGLGDHGEMQHGNLLYQSTMHVPLIVVGPGVTAGVTDVPVSTRHVYHTVLSWAGLGTTDSLIDAPRQTAGSGGGQAEVVLGEAMKPFLEYGWQPQIMSVEGTYKAISAGTIEAYQLSVDPREQRDLGSGANLPSRLSAALDDYPVPSAEAGRTPPNLDEDARRRLASLGYVSAGAAPLVRKDAPRPADMIPVMELLEKASGLFVNGQYAAVIPLLERVLASDPNNLDATLRLATAHSALGNEPRALAAFRRAKAIAPQSPDVDVYLALHLAHGKDWERAVPLLERIVADLPDRLPAVEALATIRERQGRTADAVALRERIFASRTPAPSELVHLGELAMSAGQTSNAVAAFEKARDLQGSAFTHHLELGVLYLAARRLDDAKGALDRVPPSSPDYSMALFKRAQVSVLLSEPDRAARIDAARQHADPITRPMIAKERLFEAGRTP